MCCGPSGEAVRARLCVVFLGKGWAITGKTRLDSHPHSLSERYLDYRMEHKSSIENCTKLAEKYRQLYEVCKSQREQFESLVDDKESLAELPKLDEHLLEIVEKTA